MNENCETTDQREHLGQYIAGEYVFTFFFKIQKCDFLHFFEVKNVESVVQVFTFLHFEIANGHFHCTTITHMSGYLI